MKSAHLLQGPDVPQGYEEPSRRAVDGALPTPACVSHRECCMLLFCREELASLFPSLPTCSFVRPQTLLFCGNLSSAAKPNENLALGEKGEFLEFLALVEIFKWQGNVSSSFVSIIAVAWVSF